MKEAHEWSDNVLMMEASAEALLLSLDHVLIAG